VPVPSFGAAGVQDHPATQQESDMTGNNQHQPKTADEILETEEEAMIRFAIERSLRQDAAEHALVWLEKVSNLIAVLGAEMPELLEEFDL
jgi:hypothetical protein